jgi:hypothetical protein
MSSNKVEETTGISDTSCLIILDKLGKLSVLPQLFSTVLMTCKIAAEDGQILPEWTFADADRRDQTPQVFDLIPF